MKMNTDIPINLYDQYYYGNSEGKEIKTTVLSINIPKEEQEALITLGKKNPFYYKSEKEIILKKEIGDIIYEYDFTPPKGVVLKEQYGCEKSKNSLAVSMEGITIAYMEDTTGDLRKAIHLRRIHRIRGLILGGPNRVVSICKKTLRTVVQEKSGSYSFLLYVEQYI